MVLPSSPIKILDKSVDGFMSYDRTYKQTNKHIDYSFIDAGMKIVQTVHDFRKKSLWYFGLFNRSQKIWKPKLQNNLKGPFTCLGFFMVN